ncbi:unnamed protein product [Timema podura]|uniref:Uncharacterized protein n=1 Tax=Timema podura TaxID=61482 RepID=A0ABN7P8K2_TIMPD|nr:unnamed protein product [Timema podura]
MADGVEVTHATKETGNEIGKKRRNADNDNQVKQKKKKKSKKSENESDEPETNDNHSNGFVDDLDNTISAPTNNLESKLGTQTKMSTSSDLVCRLCLMAVCT